MTGNNNPEQVIDLGTTDDQRVAMRLNRRDDVVALLTAGEARRIALGLLDMAARLDIQAEHAEHEED